MINFKKSVASKKKKNTFAYEYVRARKYLTDQLNMKICIQRITHRQ